MSKLKKQGGDTHNFGRSVEIEDGWVKKPRTLYWEWLFLSKESPIRKLSVKLAKELAMSDPFSFYPDLVFKFDTSRESLFPYSGEVAFFNSESADKIDGRDLSIGFGKCLANSFFWGVTDLHSENLGVGFSEKNTKPLIFPLDIEAIFFGLGMASDTYLLKSIKNRHDAVGSNVVTIGSLEVPLIVDGFKDVLEFYTETVEVFRKVVIDLNVQNIPIRNILRATSDYYLFLKNKLPETDFFPEELNQLNREDIPFFYTYLDDEKTYFLGESGRKEVSIEILQELVEDFPAILRVSTFSRRIEGEAIFQSMLQIARTFDPECDKIVESEKTRIRYKGDFIYLNRDGIKVKCERLK